MTALEAWFKFILIFIAFVIALGLFSEAIAWLFKKGKAK